MSAKLFSVNKRRLKKSILIIFLIFLIIWFFLSFFRFERVLYPNIDEKPLKAIILPKIISSSTLSIEDRKKLRNILNIFEKEQIEIDQIIIDEYQDVYFISKNENKFIFNFKKSEKEIFSVFISYFQSEKWKNLNKEEKNMLEYVDARFANKIFIKRKDSKLSDLATSTRE